MRAVFAIGLLAIAWGAPIQAEVVAPDGTSVRIAVVDVASRPEPVAAWQPNSVQRLVRIDGSLYQQDRGFFYRVIDDHVTVRLAPDVADWQTLVGRAAAADPGFSPLEALTPTRQNRLGIVDLALPYGSPTAWAALIFETGLARYAEVAAYGVYTVTPDDPQYSQQWALNNTGQTGGTPGADVDAERAWDISAGNPDVIVAVLDSGTDVDHPDLEDNVWINEDETPSNGQDDDANGYVDDWIGWDFENNNNDPNGSISHGTQVTGIIGAVTDNGVGVAGLAGGIDGQLGVRTMACGVGSNAPVGSVLDDAIIYAADNGARVITMSLTVGNSSAINDALDYAYNQQDVFVDCASGNNGPSVGYPALRPEVMAVASTTDDDVKSSFSNAGPEVEVAAPGSSILSTQIGGYGSGSGTSFAAPYVAALAGLVRGLNPNLSAPAVRQLIIDSADDVGPAGYDEGTGWGRINAYEALLQAGDSDGTIELDADLYPCADALTVQVTDFDLAGNGSISIVVTSDQEPAGESLLLTETDPGVYSGSLALGQGSPGADGILQAADQNTVTAEYVDANDGQGGIDVLKTDSATTDCLGPQITGVGSSDVDTAQALISWNTHEPGTSLVRYGESFPPAGVSAAQQPVTAHAITLSDLEECTTYLYEVESSDAVGNVTTDDNGGAYYTFQTLGDFPGVGVVPCQQGQAELDSNVYGCSSAVQVAVTDWDLNLDPDAVDMAPLWMTSTTEPAGEWVATTETGADTGRFEGSIALSGLAAIPDGTLSVTGGDLITATYFDADDGSGQPNVVTATATTDCEPTAISDIQVVSLSSTRAEIEWTTAEPASSRVEFGMSPTLGSVAEDIALATSHRLAISAFAACDRVYFRLSSTDEFGDVAIGDDGGQPFEFNLDRIGGLVFHDNFESDRGWTLEGEWEISAPQGLGPGDPQSAFSGSGVLGNDLSGSGANAGDYEPVANEAAYSPIFSTSGASDLELILKRKLGVAPGDSATIAIVDVGTQSVWSSGLANDADWAEQRVDVSALDDRPAVQVGFRMDSSSFLHSYGWNIDELIVKDSTQPDYLACGGCVGMPTFAGLTAAFDPAPCATSGITLEWQPAPAWGTGAEGTYEIHRGLTADFVPDGGSLIASAVTGTSWTDSSAPTNVPLWYVVRARNDEDCAGQGLSDDNLTRLSATETLTQLPPGGVGLLVAAQVSGAHVQLNWPEAPGADHYVVRRSSSADFGSPENVGTTTESAFTHVNAGLEAGLHTYRVFSVNACGVEQ